MEIITALFGFLLLLLPLGLVCVGWWSFLRDPDALPKWRHRASRLALSCATLAYFWFWITFLFIPHWVHSGTTEHGFQVYKRIGEAGVAVTLLSFLLALTARGVPRVTTCLSAIGVLFMWLSIGLIPY